MRNIELPVWLNRGQVKKLAALFQSWWQKVEGWLQEPLRQIDTDTCALGVLNLIAWGRNVKRFYGEPESLYRLRVKHAHANAIDAGSVAGTKRVFERLGVGYVEIFERVQGKDWDVVVLQLSDSQLSQNQTLLKLLLQKYGRTCRRYEFNLITPVGLGISAHEFNHHYFYDVAN